MKASILALLTALTAHLNTGLDAYKSKEYDRAIKEFTEVIDAESEFDDLLVIALYYRARSWEQKGNKEKALEDLALLMKTDMPDKFADTAIKQFLALGGDLKKLRPKDGPLKVWEAFRAAASHGNAEKCLEMCTGQWRMMLNSRPGENREMLMQMHAQMPVVVGEEIFDRNGDTARLMMKLQNNKFNADMALLFELDKKRNRWLISQLAPVRDEDFPEQEIIAEDVQVSTESATGEEAEKLAEARGRNTLNLKQIGLACRMYSQDFDENFPPDLANLRQDGYLEDADIFLWADASGGKGKLEYIYCPGLTETDPVEMMLAADVKPLGGKRVVLFIDGHVETLTDSEFMKRARKQEWKLPGRSISPDKVAADIKKKVAELVKRLGDDDYDVRENATRELKKMDPDGHAALQRYLDHEDPEVRFRVKDILDN